MREELAALEGCTRPKHRRYAEETGSNAGSQRNSPMIAPMPPRPGLGSTRGVPRGRDGGGPQDLRNPPVNPAAPPAPSYKMKVE